MKSKLLFFIVLLTVLGALTLDSFIFTVIYLLAITTLMGGWWLKQTIHKLHLVRSFPTHVFPGEIISVQLSLTNGSILPIPWLYIQESLPVELSNARIVRQVLSLPGKGDFTLHYQLYPQKRGYYSLGPLQISSGDLLGLSSESTRQSTQNFLTVYPTVVPLSSLKIPSLSLLGNIKYKQPIFEDASRPSGKRRYTSGDSLRRIDWKSTAASGQLQVKVFEPSIAFVTQVVLDLSRDGYHPKTQYDATELSVVVAASLASWISNKKHAVGLTTNGIDAFENQSPQVLPPRKGYIHLTRFLETLARIKVAQTTPIIESIRKQRVQMSWGSTIIVISGSCDNAMFAEFLHCRKSGINIMVILCGEIIGKQDIINKSKILAIPLYLFHDKHDLNIWRL